MYELDKAAFGHFLAQLRREKGMTQKELAATLYVSDKAVSYFGWIKADRPAGDAVRVRQGRQQVGTGSFP